MSRVILVLGCHRSGTSATSGIISHLGVYMGPGLEITGKCNPKGFYEAMDFQKINRQVIKSWTNPDPDGITDETRAEYARLITDRNRHHKIWGMKDPRLCVTAKHIYPLLGKNVRAVSTDRSKEAVVASLQTRDKKM